MTSWNAASGVNTQYYETGDLAGVYYLLLETGDHILMETGDKIFLENTSTSVTGYTKASGVSTGFTKVAGQSTSYTKVAGVATSYTKV